MDPSASGKGEPHKTHPTLKFNLVPTRKHRLCVGNTALRLVRLNSSFRQLSSLKKSSANVRARRGEHDDCPRNRGARGRHPLRLSAIGGRPTPSLYRLANVPRDHAKGVASCLEK
jgi:hypothetical protein